MDMYLSSIQCFKSKSSLCYVSCESSSLGTFFENPFIWFLTFFYVAFPFSNVLRIGNGGAISALGNSYVGVEFSTFEGNSAFNGGAIYNMGYTNVNNTHFYDNKAIIGVS